MVETVDTSAEAVERLAMRCDDQGWCGLLAPTAATLRAMLAAAKEDSTDA